MKTIPLSQGKVAVVDDEDFDYLSQFKWHVTNKGYASRKDGKSRKTILMHRLIMGVTELSRHIFVDHVDRDTLNNTRENLRSCTHAQNQWNKAKQDNKTSQYKGVTWDKEYSKWRVSICKDSKTKNLGRFENEVEAAIVYNKAALQIHGEFALINDIPA